MRFYEEHVRPVLHIGYPGLPYSAALLGRGSEVLGFDDEMSRDHNWEPRVLLFLREDDYTRHGEAVQLSLRDALPAQFAGYPTQFSVSTLRTYVQEHLDLDVDGEIEARDWLTLPEQRLRMVTAGAVYHDEVGLPVLRDRLAYHPHDVGPIDGVTLRQTVSPSNLDSCRAIMTRWWTDGCLSSGIWVTDIQFLWSMEG